MCTNFLKFLVLIWLNLGFTLLHTTNDNNNTKKNILFPSFLIPPSPQICELNG
jgi:hypothetical protein